VQRSAFSVTSNGVKQLILNQQNEPPTSAPPSAEPKKTNKGIKGKLTRLTVKPSTQGYRRTSDPSAYKKIPKRATQYPTRQPGGQSAEPHSTSKPSVSKKQKKNLRKN
jgi:hypothetical protein